MGKMMPANYVVVTVSDRFKHLINPDDIHWHDNCYMVGFPFNAWAVMADNEQEALDTLIDCMESPECPVSGYLMSEADRAEAEANGTLEDYPHGGNSGLYLNEPTANMVIDKLHLQKYRVSVTYERWNDEALEAGDTDDKGIELEEEEQTFMELMETIKTYSIDRKEEGTACAEGKEESFTEPDTLYNLHVASDELSDSQIHEMLKTAIDMVW